ncbi:hypothetical protein OHA72_40675 [Dactylosporangium sp. NBC_01737]|uniref:hypothetical protein n=1 Tax=Dactylosporangium sp. NBC_01737 TaxID=2975959 RepID=UPI002E1591BA|nr:hypothetical protein OHA72_40675 [Dactylosporangium sp. NBC_01737]
MSGPSVKDLPGGWAKVMRCPPRVTVNVVRCVPRPTVKRTSTSGAAVQFGAAGR